MKKQIWTFPNIISMCRILMIPLFAWFFLQSRMASAAVIFALAALTDWLDGYLARKTGQITELGVFLDQFADKLLVISSLILLAALPELNISFWIVGIIILRDLFMIFARLTVKRRTGISLRTNYWGKIKSAVQMVSVTAIILLLFFRSLQGNISVWARNMISYSIPLILMLICLIFALFSWIVYLVQNRKNWQIIFRRKA